MQITLVRLATLLSGKGMQIARVRTLGNFTEEKSESPRKSWGVLCELLAFVRCVDVWL